MGIVDKITNQGTHSGEKQNRVEAGGGGVCHLHAAPSPGGHVVPVGGFLPVRCRAHLCAYLRTVSPSELYTVQVGTICPPHRSVMARGANNLSVYHCFPNRPDSRPLRTASHKDRHLLSHSLLFPFSPCSWIWERLPLWALRLHQGPNRAGMKESNLTA